MTKGHERIRRLRIAAFTAFAILPHALSASGEPVPLNAFNLPPGASITITFDVDVDSPLGVCASAISNQGTFTATNHANVLTDDPSVGGAADPTVTPLDAIDLAITKTDGATSEIPGTLVVYTVVASNGGPATAIGVTVADDFPAILIGCNTMSVAAGGATGNELGPVAGDWSDTGITLPVGGTVTYTSTCTIDPAATGTLANTATVTQSGTQLECVTANNSATDSDTLAPEADLSISKNNGVTSIDAGGTTTYTIIAANSSGPSTATGVTVADSFDFTKLSGCSTTSVASGATGNDPGPFSGNINDSGITLPVGSTVTYTSVCTLLGTASGTLSNTATVSTAISDPNSGNNSSTDGPDTINPIADLSITKDDGTTTAVAGLSTTYTIVAANAGPATATAALVADTFPGALTCSWTCVASLGASCTTGPVAGDISDSVTLPASGSATYTAVCQIAPTATGTIVNTATISGGGVSDTTPGNNTATDTDTLLPLDFGDAPDSYATLLATNGARHGVNGGGALRLGALIDTEADGLPNAGATGDDSDGVDDEEGVTPPATIVACATEGVAVFASAAARLDAFVDFNNNGNFADGGEKIFNNLLLAAGVNNLTFAVPCAAIPTAQTYARFRLSTAGNLSWNGVAADGEVEDYAVAVRGLDFGDAPDTPYPTLFASNGARHVVTGGGPVLGVAPDTEANGQPNATATGDDAAGTDDEDGVVFTSPLIRGQNAAVTVTASAAGVLNAWINFNADGNWTTAGDQIFTNQALVAGANNLNFAVPGTATTSLSTFARFRVATASGLSFNGLANDGEVEDHAVQTAAEANVAISKSDGSATEIPGTTVTYTIVASNAGPDTAAGVTVADTFPGILSGCSTTSGVTGGATGNDAGPFAGHINDGGITLPVGATVTYSSTCTIAASATGTLVNTATIASGVNDPVPGDNTATDTDTLTPEADLAISKTDGSATEVPGTPVTYTISATNSTGPSVATAVVVTDTFPGTLSGCAWTSVAGGGATGNDNGSGHINDSGITLPVGGSVTYTATCNIASSATGTLSNTATVATGVTDPNNTNNSATDTDTLTPQADLAISKSDDSANEVPGTPVTYTITSTNATGPSDAALANVSDSFPGTISGVLWSCLPAGGATCPANGSGNINATVNLPLGGTVIFTATGNIASSATGTLENTATVAVAIGTTDPTPGNNSATDTDTLVPSADLEITKSDSADPPPAGQDLVYTIAVENLGPSDAVAVQVTDPLPGPVTYVSDSCGGSNIPPWTWNIGALAAGATVSCDVTVSINPAPPASISNTATVTSTTADPNSLNNSDTEETTLDAIPPEVDNLSSILDTGDGTLAECESALVPISSLVATFSEAMANPAGDADPDDVTNPANFLLVTPGGDLAFDTTICPAPAGDDTAVVATVVAYDGGTFTATASFGVLPDGPYRLLICPTLTDLAGNPLDGDGNDTGGDEFERNFRADPDNRLANGHFDCDLSGWTVSEGTPGEILWDAADAAGAAESGSAETTNLAPGFDITFALEQCAENLLPGAQQLGARLRLSAAPLVFVSFTGECEYFANPGCGGSLGTASASQLIGDSAGVWLALDETLAAPAGAVSARCEMRFDTPTGVSFTANLDDLSLGLSGLIFSDDFESGDTNAWSSCTGCAP